jgi:hypothetical protein
MISDRDEMPLIAAEANWEHANKEELAVVISSAS